MKNLCIVLSILILLLTGCSTGSNPVTPETPQNVITPEPESGYVIMIYGTMNLDDGTITYHEERIEKDEQ